jgi:AcrR family transcriptional regulator
VADGPERENSARERLVLAARALFGERGFDRVTVAEIADAAGVTSRTFFRHFVTKEEVLFADHERSVALVERELACSGAARPIVEIVRSALSEIMRQFDEEPERSLERFRLELSSRSVEATALRVTQSWVRAITKDIASRLDVDPVADPRPHLIASLANMAARLAIDTWVELEGSASIRLLALNLFDLMTSGIGLEQGPASRQASRSRPEGHEHHSRSPSSSITRRERKRNRTRAELFSAAVELVKERGFDATTIEVIADRADYALRTFFRYFPAREDVLFADQVDLLSDLEVLVDRAPTDQSMLDIARDAMTLTARSIERDRDFAMSRNEIARRDRNVYAAGLRNQHAWVRTMRTALARRIGVDATRDLRPAAIAAAASVAIYNATFRWGAMSGNLDLRAEAERNMELILTGLRS